MSENKKFVWEKPKGGGLEVYDLEFDERSVERAVERVQDLAPVPKLTNLEKIDLREKLKKNLELAKQTEEAHTEFDPYTSAAVEFLIDNYDYDPRMSKDDEFIRELRRDKMIEEWEKHKVTYDILKRHLAKKQEKRNKL